MEPMIKLTRIKTYNCNECTEIFLSEDKLEKHSQIHTKQWLCAYTSPESVFSKIEDCEFRLPTNRECALRETPLNILREVKSNNPETHFKCEYCFLKFETESTFEAHWLRHQHFPYTCHCGNVYHLLSDLETHTSLAHPVKQEKSWESDACNVGSNTNPEFSNANYEIQENVFPPDSDEENFDESPVKSEKTNSNVEKNLILLPEKAKPKIEKEKSKQNHNEKGPDFFMSVIEDGSFSCLKCNSKFNKKSTFRSHYYRQHKRKFICPKCDKSFGDRANLRVHMVTHLDKSDWPYSCSICNRRFTQVGTAKLHYKRVHARIKDQICRYCKKAFSDRANLVNHERIHTGNKPFECNYCDKRFSDPSACKRHIRTHTGDKIYACPECPMRFTDASGLIAHKLRHAGIKKYKCDICDKGYVQMNLLKNHVERVHIGIRKFECHYCRRKCSAKHNLQTHIQTVHRKEFGGYLVPKLFECAHCRKIVSTKNNLKRHIVIKHRMCLGLKEQQFECDYCGEKMKHIDYLRKHIYSLHGEMFGKPPKRVQCHFCNRSYTKRNLNKHIKVLHGIQTP